MWYTRYEFPGEWSEIARYWLYYVWFDLVDWFSKPARKQRLDRFGRCEVLVRWDYQIGECIKMARKRASGSDIPVTLKKFDPSRSTAWANVDLAETDKLAIRGVAANAELVASEFLGLTDEGMEITLKIGAKGDWMACLFGDTPDGVRHGMSAYAKTPTMAAAALCYKWRAMLNEVWPSGTLTSPTDDMS